MKKIKITIKENKKAKNEVIRKVGKKKWCLYSKKKGKDGERKNLGAILLAKGRKREKNKLIILKMSMNAITFRLALMMMVKN